MTESPPDYRFDSHEEVTAVIERPLAPRLMPTPREVVTALLFAAALVASMAIGVLATVGAMAVIAP